MAIFIMGAFNINAEFVMPSEDQILSATKNPVKIESIFKDASVTQASIVLLSVVQQIQLMDLTIDEKIDKVNELFIITQKIFGNDAIRIISDVVSRMNPDLMPTVYSPGASIVSQSSLPISIPLAPPIAIFYTGQ